ncbi:MAG TPA: PAS domain-containing protein, partial [Chitinophagaceae bacterium]|nr:PAS domain-containing protein [Chitinophagaceae bacterium]
MEIQGVQHSYPFLMGGGKMGELIREKDWSETSLGIPEYWPQSLRTTISTCLNSRFPILVWWGPDLVMLYNDAYRPMLGEKHPASLGEKGRLVWPEIWNIIGPMLHGVYEQGLSTWSENQLLLLNRHGFAEECYFTFSYSPIYDESGGIGGVYCAVTETTETVLNEWQLKTLQEINNPDIINKTADDVYRSAGKA